MWERFCELRRIMGGKCRAQVIRAMVGQLLECGLSPGTIKVYLEHVKYFARDNGQPFTPTEMTRWKWLHKCATLCYAKRKDDGRLPLSLAEASEVLRKVSELSLVAASALFIIITCGLRACALCHLRMRDILFVDGKSGGRLQISVRIDKNVNDPSKKRVIDETLGVVGVSRPLGFKAVVSNADEEFPFAAWDVNALNSIIRQAGLPHTTYNLRKMYGVRKYVENKGDLQRFSAVYGHTNPRMAQAHYLSIAGLQLVHEYERVYGYAVGTLGLAHAEQRLADVGEDAEYEPEGAEDDGV